MSCLRIRLSPAKSAWKRFASKLMKLQRSKPIKNRLKTRPTAVRKTHLKKLRSERVFLLRLKRACLFKKKRDAVVYVDKLFRPTQMEEKKNVEKPLQVDDADEAWESMGLASPLVQGIDARAEEFIARIKAQMKTARAL
ncbi:PREDICTED: uncharacterized protein LOC104814518 [Tarenaya hassleriana]|uniref:uncharacterized protein LOC104814518 n=1 Tax=Tarenaya hassleriana TaxID=28532 RepID=UPI00053C7ECA|nr:PREDICTED: uncharacterized protein LOC104814518 [Tarenaya hassleriana]